MLCITIIIKIEIMLETAFFSSFPHRLIIKPNKPFICNFPCTVSLNKSAKFSSLNVSLEYSDDFSKNVDIPVASA